MQCASLEQDINGTASEPPPRHSGLLTPAAIAWLNPAWELLESSGEAALEIWATQGAQRLPWAAKVWLGARYFQLLNLSDRLYGAWAGQADFQKLGVSCGRNLTVATPII